MPRAMELGLDGRVAIVGGASKGIGRACAAALAAEGASVVLVARSEDEVRQAAAELGEGHGTDRVHAVAADLSVPADIERAVKETTERYGRCDIAINNLGGPPPGQPSALTDEQWQAALDLNFMSATRLDRLVVPMMREQGYGRIITILSLSIKQPEENLTLSTVARTAAATYARLLALEVAADGITVNNILPGFIETDRLQLVAEMQARLRGQDIARAMDLRRDIIAAKRFGTPQEVGDLVTFLSSERAAFVTGQNISIDGGQLRALV